MNLESLPQYNGASVQIILDGEPALALIFLEINCIQVTSLCFLGRTRRCPLVRHNLNEAEIESITPVSRNELKSEITLTSKKKTSAPDAASRIKDELIELHERVQVLKAESNMAIARSVELRAESERSISRCTDAGEKLQRTRSRKGCINRKGCLAVP